MWNGELNVGIPITWRNNETYIYAYIYFNLIIQTLFSLKRYSGMLLASIHIFKLNFIPLGAQRVIDTGLSVHSHECGMFHILYHYWTLFFFFIGNQKNHAFENQIWNGYTESWMMEFQSHGETMKLIYIYTHTFTLI